MKLFAPTPLIMVLSFSCVAAESNPISDLLLGRNYASRPDRIELAKALFKNIDALARYLPTPEPKDAEWISQEKQAIALLGNSDAAQSREGHLMVSAPIHHQKLFNYLNALRGSLQCAANPDLPVSREMWCWSVASLYLTGDREFSESIALLVEAGVLPKDIVDKAHLSSDPDHLVGCAWMYGMWGKSILEYIVVPYLQGQSEP